MVNAVCINLVSSMFLFSFTGQNSTLTSVRIKGGMSLRNGIWHGSWNEITMQNIMTETEKCALFLAPINLQMQPLF